MPARFWSRAWKRVPWLQHLSGRIWPPSTADAGVAQWISSWQASPASPTQQPENEGEQQTAAGGSGQKSSALFGSVNLALCSSKTCPVCSRHLPSRLLAYAAGLIDGEGCIGIASTTTQSRTRYWPMLRVTMTNPQPLGRLADLFGGRVLSVKRTSQHPNQAPTATWSLGGSALACVLKALRPLLVVKRGQAELVLQLLNRPWPLSENGRGIRWTPEVSADWERAKNRMHELNQTGRGLPPGAFALLVGPDWMTVQRNLLGARWEKFSGPWPSSGSLRNGICSARPTSAHRTSGNGSSCWPTPTAEDFKTDGPIALGRLASGRPKTCDIRLRNRVAIWPTPDAMVAQDGEGEATWRRRQAAMKAKGYNGNGCGTPLAMAASLWPTPVKADSDRGNDAYANREGNPTLKGAVSLWKTPHGFANTDFRGKTGGGGGEFAKQAMLWATPRAEDGESCGNHPGANDSLTGQTTLWATPNARDWRSEEGGDAMTDWDARRKVGAPLSRQVRQTPTPGPPSSSDGRNSPRRLAKHLAAALIRNL